jgi:hypothetical protein
VSRASWLPLEDGLRRLLVARDVSKAGAQAIASEIVDACGHYLVRLKFEVVPFATRRALGDFRLFLNRAASVAEELRTLLERQPTSVRPYWTREDRDDLQLHLKKLIEATQTYDQRLRPGPKPDFKRHGLEDTVALVLLRNGVTPTTAKTGTFALVLEQVHSTVGIHERDVHKSVRRAHDALMRAKTVG